MIRWADPERMAEAVEGYVDRLRRERPEVRKVYWYGSWTTGTPTPRSDADLCVIVEEDDRPRHQRVPDYLPERFPVGVDLTVLTEAEFARLPDASPGWYRVITAGREL